MDLSGSKGKVVAVMIAFAAIAVLILARGCGGMGETASPAPASVSEDEGVTTESLDEKNDGGDDATNEDSSADNSLEIEGDASGNSIESALQESPAVVDSDGRGSLPVARRQQDAISEQHEHSWVAQTEQRWVQDSAAWDEPVYQTEERAICAGCGADITNAISSHYTRKGCVNGSSASNWRYVTNSVVVGTTHHEATGHYETVTTGYICSGCGASK